MAPAGEDGAGPSGAAEADLPPIAAKLRQRRAEPSTAATGSSSKAPAVSNAATGSARAGRAREPTAPAGSRAASIAFMVALVLCAAGWTAFFVARAQFQDSGSFGLDWDLGWLLGEPAEHGPKGRMGRARGRSQRGPAHVAAPANEPLRAIAAQILHPEKGILAADESPSTFGKRVRQGDGRARVRAHNSLRALARSPCQRSIRSPDTRARPQSAAGR
jgi:hypothetical protein